MENINKKRLLIGILVLLILINLTALATFGYHRFFDGSITSKNMGRHDKTVQNPHDRVKSFIKKELQLNEEQFRSYCSLKDVNNKNSDEIWKTLLHLREATLLEITSDMPDSVRLTELSDSIGICHKNMQLEMNRHFLTVKKMLTPEQIVKYNELLIHIDKGDWRNRANGKENDRGRGYKNRNRRN